MGAKGRDHVRQGGGGESLREKIKLSAGRGPQLTRMNELNILSSSGGGGGYQRLGRGACTRGMEHPVWKGACLREKIKLSAGRSPQLTRMNELNILSSSAEPFHNRGRQAYNE